ncbi:YdeI/OmpD-associated family protein [Microbulbifer variabilis]|uniref:YdeI/OmpD-associated family protein n=1 Tax=Microbulbifer variabilis TaxID=266805 RepID=UPI001CFEEB67
MPTKALILRFCLIALKNNSTSNDATLKWQKITPLARNEWICWVIDAKKDTTRNKRIDRAIEDLKSGKQRPCCWPGCPHRIKNGKA